MRCLFFALFFLSTVGSAQSQSFLYTEFADADAWEVGTAASGTRTITEEGYRFDLPGPDFADMSSGLSATADDGLHDYSVRAKIHYNLGGSGVFAGITARSFKGRPSVSRESVFSMFGPNGSLFFGWADIDGTPTVVESGNLGFSPLSEDVFLQVDMLGDHFHVTAWSPDVLKPAAQFSTELVRPKNGGGIALLLSGSRAPSVTFGSFESRPPGDTNGDFVVDAADLDLIMRQINEVETVDMITAGWSDVNGDGLVSILDRDYWMTAVVPEPSTSSLLMLAGFVGLLRRRR